MLSKKTFLLAALLILSFFMGAQFHKQEIWPFGQGYYHAFKMIKKYGLDYKDIVTEEQKDRNLRKFYLDQELKAKATLVDFTAEKIETLDLVSGNKMDRYLIQPGIFNLGISNMNPGSGYLDFYGDDLFLLSARGILGYTKDLEGNELFFKQIKNNLNDFINEKQFLKPGYKSWFSFKDLTIAGDKIFISYTEEISEDCWNTSVLFSEINYENLIFIKLFSAPNCISSNRKFNATEAGGRIVTYDNEHILLTVGNYGFKASPEAQDPNMVNGKILKINIDDSSFEFLSMGHRNPQGLLYNQNKNFLIETEHGPSGGDEINIVELDLPLKKNNFGWPLASYGKNYGDDKPVSQSHKAGGFQEPIKYFIPSIGISEILNIGGDNYVVGSMSADRALRFFSLGHNNIYEGEKRISVKERIRDLKFKNGKLFLFLEDTASIGVINLKSSQ